jgi:DNA-directed RNA polymerase subunit E'/Rpb7
MTSKIFHESILTGKVKLKPSQINKNYLKYISEALDKNYQGKFTKYGLIRHGSIKLLESDMGQIEQNSLEGYVNYNVRFQAEVCLPANGMILLSDVISTNTFGVMCTITDHDNKKSKSTDPIIKIIVPKNSPAIKSDIILAEVISGNKVYVEIMGVKPQLNDSLICCIGRIIRISGKNKNNEENNDNETKKIYTQVDPTIIVEGLQFNDDELAINELDINSDGDGDDIDDDDDEEDEDDDDSADKKSSRIGSKKSKQNKSGNNKKYVYNVITDEYELIENINGDTNDIEGENNTDEISEEEEYSDGSGDDSDKLSEDGDD